ncbi:MAG: glycoside hydrolase family 52 protein [Chthoniobacteraceae bacterium]
MNQPSSYPSYHSQHSPFGAFASFTIGLVGSPGGFAQSISRADQAQQNVYVGFRAGGKTWQVLPFFSPRKSAEINFTVEAATTTQDAEITTLSPKDYERNLGWASDTWRADHDRFGFSLLSPFFQVPDPRELSKANARLMLAPVVTAWIEYDNRQGKEAVELIFGIGDPSRPLRPFSDTPGANSLTGFASGTAFGYATAPSEAVEVRQGFDVFAPKFRDYRGLHLIGGESALVFNVKAGQRKRFPLTLAFYVEGTVSTGLPSVYAYTRYFSSLEEVLDHGLSNHQAYVRQAEGLDAKLLDSNLNENQQFLLAQATHSYYGSSQLLWKDDGPLWVVNEGEYRMINTFDLTVDHLFFELDWHPWAVRDTLDLFVERYAYTDRIHNGTAQLFPGGISFVHDMGVMNHFTPPGRSSYECDDLTGCFGHMTMEQLLNWVLCAVVYAEKMKNFEWLHRHQKVLLACAESLHHRDNPLPEKRDGILKYDSARCGTTGSEITTYDSLDVSLGQARNNLYLAVKTLAAWILLEKAFVRLTNTKAAEDAAQTADLLAKSLIGKFDTEKDLFPAVFENGNQSRILPVVEGFVYPIYLNYKDVIDRNGRFGNLLKLMERHLKQAFRPGVCLDEVTGGWKISSTSNNTWFSKIAIAQYVIEHLFPRSLTKAARAADRVHADWQRQPGCGRDAMCDQIWSDTGESCGSRYYPRCVTSYLWFEK